jgi:hypothetical protein
MVRTSRGLAGSVTSTGSAIAQSDYTHIRELSLRSTKPQTLAAETGCEELVQRDLRLEIELRQANWPARPCVQWRAAPRPAVRLRRRELAATCGFGIGGPVEATHRQCVAIARVTPAITECTASGRDSRK